MKWWLVISLPFYGLDQLTKYLTQRNIPVNDGFTVIPGLFDLVHVHNTGAAFGMMSNNNYFFVGLAGLALVVLAVLSIRKTFKDRISQIAAALLVSGVAGNLTDRLLHGHVVDFLSFTLPWYGPWPAFNVADSCICVSAGLFIISSFLDGKGSKVAPSSVV
ncbi:signal peptidase II [soil metagenome]